MANSKNCGSFNSSCGMLHSIWSTTPQTIQIHSLIASSAPYWYFASNNRALDNHATKNDYPMEMV